MSRLLSLKLYSQTEMLGILVEAGQFAHVSSDDLLACLETLFDPWFYRYHGTDDDEFTRCHPPRDVADAVGGDLFASWHQGLSPKLYKAEGTLAYLGKKLGIICPLCARIERDDHYAGDLVDFYSFVTPSFLICQNMGEYGESPGLWTPLAGTCRPCSDKVEGRVRGNRMRSKKRIAERDELFWAECLLHLLIDDIMFRDRVRENAGNWKRLRFDPRKAIAT